MKIQKSDLVENAVMKLPITEYFGLTEYMEQQLSKIIDEITGKTDKTYDDVIVKAIVQIRDILMKSKKLKTSAKNNK